MNLLPCNGTPPVSNPQLKGKGQLLKRNKYLLILACSGMELAWLYAWAAFITACSVHRPFPLPEAIGTFAMAAVFTAATQGRGWRVIQIIGLQVLGFVLASLRIIYVFNYRLEPFLNNEWIVDLVKRPREPLEWLILFLILFLVLVFWIGGVTLARRSTSHLTICSRFDLGIAAFFLLLLIELLVLVKGGIEIQDPTTKLLLFPFFIFGLMAIGFARNRKSGQRDYLSGYGEIGVILSFTFVALLFGTGLVLLFLPYLTLAAEMGYGVLKSATEPLGPILVSIVRFIFGYWRIQPMNGLVAPGASKGEVLPPAQSSWWTEFFGFGLLGLFGLVSLALFGLALWYIFRWLLSRTSSSKDPQRKINLFSLWIARIRLLLSFFWSKILLRSHGRKGTVQLYASLLGWGHHSGLPRFVSETPNEYGLRLEHRFPALKKEIELIIKAFNHEVYGEMVPEEQLLKLAQLAWRNLCSPLHWPIRLRSLVLQSGNINNSLRQM